MFVFMALQTEKPDDSSVSLQCYLELQAGSLVNGPAQSNKKRSVENYPHTYLYTPLRTLSLSIF